MDNRGRRKRETARDRNAWRELSDDLMGGSSYTSGSRNHFYDLDSHKSDVSEEEKVETISERAKQLLDSAFQSWKSGLYTDVTVIIGEERFVTHRLVLASLSDYFSRLLKFDENNSGEVTLHNINPSDFEALLKYAYTGHLDVNKDNVQSLLMSADYFSVVHVKKMCVNFMTANFDLENIYYVLNLELEDTLPELIENARTFLRKNFGDFVQSETLTQLEPKYLENFFNDGDLILYSHKLSLKSAARETLILNAVLKYLSTRPDSDPANIEMLIRTVRLPLVPRDDLKTCLSNFTSFKSNPIIQKYLQLRETALKVMQNMKQDNTSKKSNPETKEIPETWFQLRKHAEFSFVSGDIQYAKQRQSQPQPQLKYDDGDLEIKKIEIWERTWEGITVIGGLVLSHQNPSNPEETLVSRRGSCPGPSHHTVELEPDEYIVKVTVGRGWLIDRLGVETNRGNVFGPFGGTRGQESTESCPIIHTSYLYDINCDAVYAYRSEAIFNLMLRWIAFN